MEARQRSSNRVWERQTRKRVAKSCHKVEEFYIELNEINKNPNQNWFSKRYFNKKRELDSTDFVKSNNRQVHSNGKGIEEEDVKFIVESRLLLKSSIFISSL